MYQQSPPIPAAEQQEPEDGQANLKEIQDPDSVGRVQTRAVRLSPYPSNFIERCFRSGL